MKHFLILGAFLTTLAAAQTSKAQVQLPKGWTVTVLLTGDYGCDGHCKTERRFYFTNIDDKTRAQAYAKAVKLVGFDLTVDIASEYQEAGITDEQIKMLEKWGIESQLQGTESDLDPNSVSLDEYYAIYLAMVKLGHPQSQFVPLNDNATDIGGYGLFE